MASSSNVPADATNTVANDTCPMWDLVVNQVGVDEEEGLLQEMLSKLAEVGITKPFQFMKAPDALLLSVFPMDTCARHYLAATYVRDEQRKWEAQQSM